MQSLWWWYLVYSVEASSTQQDPGWPRMAWNQWSMGQIMESISAIFHFVCLYYNTETRQINSLSLSIFFKIWSGYFWLFLITSSVLLWQKKIHLESMGSSWQTGKEGRCRKHPMRTGSSVKSKSICLEMESLRTTLCSPFYMFALIEMVEACFCASNTIVFAGNKMNV